MQTTHTPIGLHWPVAEQPVNARLSWLLDANAYESERLLHESVDEQIMLMRRPVSIERAYALFGMLLGTLPPAAIFYRMFGNVLKSGRDEFGLLMLLFMMNVVCCVAGLLFAAKLSDMADRVERGARKAMLILPLLIGLLWGAGTGGVGGVLFFGIGAFFGMAFAIPVGILAFSLFMPLHRWLAHGGMIEASHLWPLACGVTMAITALILGL